MGIPFGLHGAKNNLAAPPRVVFIHLQRTTGFLVSDFKPTYDVDTVVIKLGAANGDINLEIHCARLLLQPIVLHKIYEQLFWVQLYTVNPHIVMMLANHPEAYFGLHMSLNCTVYVLYRSGGPNETLAILIKSIYISNHLDTTNIQAMVYVDRLPRIHSNM